MLLPLVLAALGLALVELHYARMTDGLLRPPRRPVTPADLEHARAVLPSLEEVSFRSRDGLLLRAYYVPSRNGATVVMGHGLEQNGMALVPEAVILARHGYGSLLLDWRAHGASEGDVCTWGDREQDDVRAAVDYLAARPDASKDRIGALGFSVGANAVAEAAAADDRLKAVVLEAVYTSFDDELTHKMGARGLLSLAPARAVVRLRGIRPERIRPIDHVRAIAPRPILFVTGSREDNTLPEVVQRVFDSAGEPKQLLVLNAGHGGYAEAEPERYESALVGFLDAALLR